MKCPNCYNQNEPGRTTCKYCGTPLPDEPEEASQESEVQENVEDESTQEYREEEPVIDREEIVEEQEYTEKTKKEKKKMSKKAKTILILVFFFIILIGAGAAGIYYYISITTPDIIYKNTITTGLNTLFNNDIYDIKSGKINAKIELQTDESGELGEYNGLTIDTQLGFSLNDEQALIKLDVKNGEDEYLASTLYGDLKRQKLYVGDDNLYEKLLSIDIPDEYVSQIESAIDFKELSQRDTSTQRSQIAQVLIDAINSNLKAENITRESAKITYNGKQKSVKDNKLTLTEGEFKEFATNVLTQLNSNETFLNALGDSKEDVVDAIEEVLDELSYLEDDDYVESPSTLVIHLYTSGLKYDVVGLKIEAYTGDLTEQLSAQVIKTGENTYTTEYTVIEDSTVAEQQSVSTSIEKLEDGTTNFETSFSYNDIPITLKANYEYGINEGIQDVDLENAVKYSELNTEEYTTLMNNISNSYMYAIIYSGITYLEENGMEILLNTGVNTQTQLPNNVELEQNQSYVITEDKDVAVYEVPSTFESEYSGNLYKSYSKNNRIGDKSQVYINLISGSARDIIEGYVEDYNFVYDKEDIIETNEKGEEEVVGQEDKYQDASISSVKEEIVNGVSYYRVDVKYTSGTSKNNITFYATQLTDKYSYVVKIEDSSEIISSAEKEKILSITIY